MAGEASLNNNKNAPQAVAEQLLNEKRKQEIEAIKRTLEEHFSFKKISRKRDANLHNRPAHISRREKKELSDFFPSPPQKLLPTPAVFLSDIAFTERTKRVFESHHLCTLDELFKLSEQELLILKGMGRKSIHEIRTLRKLWEEYQEI